MKALGKFISIILIAVIAAVTVSCPAEPAPPPGSGTIPYEKPKAPANLTATRGNLDSITLSWDAVDNADRYYIYGIKASDFGSKELDYYNSSNSTNITFNKDGSSNGLDKINIDFADESYIFAVTARVNYGSPTDNLFSENSDYAEGCFAPSSIDMYAVVTYDSLLIYWSVPNLFSVLSSAASPEALYTPEFTLQYRMQDWSEWRSIAKDDYDSSLEPWEFESVDLNTRKYDIAYGKNCYFRVQMQILDGNGGGSILPQAIVSEEHEVLIDTSLIPDPVENLTASKGSYTDHIEVSWTIPAWGLDVSRDNSYFTVERRIEGSGSDWTTLVDEFAAKDQLDEIVLQDDGVTLVFNDRFDPSDADAPVRGERYEYRIINTVKSLSDEGEEYYYQQETDDAAVSSAGWLYSFDSSIELAGTWNPDESNQTAAVHLDVSALSAELPSDLEYSVERRVFHAKKNEYATENIPVIMPDVSGSVSIEDFTESVADKCDLCGISGSEHRYEYYLVVRYRDGGALFEDSRVRFVFDTDPLSIGEEVKEFMITSFTASRDYVDSILIEWEAINIPDEGIVSYEYSIDNNDEWQQITTQEGLSSYCIPSDMLPEKESGDYTIAFHAVIGDETYAAPATAAGRPLDISGVTLTASSGTFSDKILVDWDENDDSFVDSSDVVYTLLINGVPADGFSYKYTDYSYTTDDTSVYGNDVSFRISAHNVKQGEGFVSETEETVGYILPVPKITSVSKGDSGTEIDVVWDGQWADKVGGYNLYIFNERVSEIGDAVPAAELSSAEISATIPNLDQGKDYYFYITALSPGDEVERAESLVFTGYEKSVENILPGQLEYVNMGYLFDRTAITDITASESYTEENGISYVNDYFTITFPANRTVKSYTVIGGEKEYEGTSETYDLSDLEFEYDEARGIYTHGNSGETKYFSYDPAKTDEAPYGTITINTATGILNDDFEVDSVNVRGYGENSLSTDTQVVPLDGISRGMNAYDYINVFNQVINAALHEISELKFEGDWCHYSGVDFNKKDDYVTDFLFARQASTWWASAGTGGIIRFTGYNPSTDNPLERYDINVELTSAGDIPFVPEAGSSLETNALNWIGNENKTASPAINMVINETVMIGSRACYFRPTDVTIYYMNISGKYDEDTDTTYYEHLIVDGEDITIDSSNERFIHHMAWE